MTVLSLCFCARAFSSFGKWGPLFIAVRGPLTVAASLVAEHRLQTRRLSSCGSQAQLLRGMWDLPRPGLEPVSPALSRQILNHCATREALISSLRQLQELVTKSLLLTDEETEAQRSPMTCPSPNPCCPPSFCPPPSPSPPPSFLPFLSLLPLLDDFLLHVHCVQASARCWED